MLQLPSSAAVERWLCIGGAIEDGTQLPPAQALAILRRSTGGITFSLRSIYSFICRAGLGSAVPRTTREQWSQIESEVRFGRVIVAERPRAISRYSHDHPVDDSDELAPPDLVPEPIDDRELALLISRCDPVLAHDPLKFTYLLRGLGGRPVSLKIVAESFPGRVVHERPLTAAETQNGPHNAEWDGVVTQAGAHQGERLSPRYGPAKVELVHDETYRDQAPFTLARIVHVVETEDLVFATGRALLKCMPNMASPQTRHQRLTITWGSCEPNSTRSRQNTAFAHTPTWSRTCSIYFRPTPSRGHHDKPPPTCLSLYCRVAGLPNTRPRRHGPARRP
ncbi:hypothetical protein [Enhygromyxa salina]|uniref:hypothetical protein n=1 Tax=Enhygromyxa salina TaxID=215803 RepID=UPI0011BA87ED|nr:hypothetical protein [Enhygromyxa salina]